MCVPTSTHLQGRPISSAICVRNLTAKSGWRRVLINHLLIATSVCRQPSPYAALVCSLPEMVGILRNSRNLVTAGSSPTFPSPPSPAVRSLLHAGGSDISLTKQHKRDKKICTPKWAELNPAGSHAHHFPR